MTVHADASAPAPRRTSAPGRGTTIAATALAVLSVALLASFAPGMPVREHLVHRTPAVHLRGVVTTPHLTSPCYSGDPDSPLCDWTQIRVTASSNTRMIPTGIALDVAPVDLPAGHIYDGSVPATRAADVGDGLTILAALVLLCATVGAVPARHLRRPQHDLGNRRDRSWGDSTESTRSRR